MANRINADDIRQSQIYENGAIYNLTVNDLLNNKVAIMHLTNDYNNMCKQVEALQKREKELSSELQYQNASPFFAIISTIINIIGTVICGCGVNFITGDKNVKVGYILLILGGLLLVVSGVMMICYKYVNKWMNKKK